MSTVSLQLDSSGILYLAKCFPLTYNLNDLKKLIKNYQQLKYAKGLFKQKTFHFKSYHDDLIK